MSICKKQGTNSRVDFNDSKYGSPKLNFNFDFSIILFILKTTLFKGHVSSESFDAF